MAKYPQVIERRKESKKERRKRNREERQSGIIIIDEICETCSQKSEVQCMACEIVEFVKKEIPGWKK